MRLDIGVLLLKGCIVEGDDGHVPFAKSSETATRQVQLVVTGRISNPADPEQKVYETVVDGGHFAGAELDVDERGRGRGNRMGNLARLRPPRSGHEECPH